jgi:hypothetical protein
MGNKTSLVQIPLSLEQLAIALRQLSPERLKDLEMLLDKKFTRLVLKRGQKAYQAYKKGQTIGLDQLQKEF